MSTVIHPYLADLPIFDSEVELIAESIREVGLLHPITLDTEGRIIGGRHRLAACKQVGVEPKFEVHEGDPLAFMLNDAARKHQSAGQRAAEDALTMDSAGRRDSGRWVGWSRLATNVASTAGERKARERCGIILDYLGRDTLVAIARGDQNLNEVHQQAEAARDAERNRKEREAAAAKAEAEAEAFIKDNAPDLGARVDGEDLLSYIEARDLWERRNAEAAEELRRKKAEEQRKERERLDGIKRDVNRVLNFLDGLAAAATLHEHPYRAEVLDSLAPHNRTRILRIEKEASWPTTL